MKVALGEIQMSQTSAVELDDRKLLGSRIREAREKLGWSQSELAQAVGFGAFQIVSAIENGQREVKAWELFKIASSLHLSLESFLGGQQKSEPVLLWRAQPQTAFREIEARFIERCERYALLEQWCGVSPLQELKPICFSLPEPTFVQVGREAENIRDYMKLGGRPACSLAKTLQEDYGVKIFYEDFGDQGAALSAKGDFGYGILINLGNAPWRRNFSLAHELFHLLTFDHWKSPRQEKLADSFASALLLPAEPLLSILRSRMTDGKLSFETLGEIAREFEVSMDALLWRTVNLGVIKKEAVEKAFKNPNLKALDKLNRVWTKPDSLPERYVRLCYTAYRTGKIGRAKLAEFLETSLVDLMAEMNAQEEEEVTNDGENQIAVVGC
jgi:Zn-dependent peptidase ImmA (M78 family)/transcriptional regulator with XRE-family HTH domain